MLRNIVPWLCQIQIVDWHLKVVLLLVDSVQEDTFFRTPLLRTLSYSIPPRVI